MARMRGLDQSCVKRCEIIVSISGHHSGLSLIIDTYCGSTVIFGSLDRRINPLLMLELCSWEPATCRSPYDRVLIIGLLGSELDISFVLGVTMAVPISFVDATVGAGGDELALVRLSV